MFSSLSIQITEEISNTTNSRWYINFSEWTGIRQLKLFFWIDYNKKENKYYYNKKYSGLIRKYKIISYIKEHKTHIEIGYSNKDKKQKTLEEII